MSGSKKSYCSVADYLSAKYVDFYQALVDTCSVPALGGAVTVVVPADSALKKIQEKINDGSPEAIKAARDHLLAHVFDGALKNGDDFKSNVVNNRMMSPKNAVATKVSNTLVKLKIGTGEVQIELDGGFNDATRRGAAVWKAKGDMPTDGAAAVRRRANDSKKTGGYSVSDYGTQNDRFKIGVAVENIASMQIASKTPAVAFCNAVYSLAKYVHSQDPSTYYARVLPNITHTPGDFYILVEPHSVGSQYLLDDGMINGWWASYDRSGRPVDRSFIDNTLKEAPRDLAAIYGERNKVIGAIAALRSDGSAKVGGSGNNGANKIIEIYKQVAGTNSIGDVSKVFPAELAEIYKSSPMRRMIEDDVRYYVDCAIEVLYRSMAGRKASDQLQDLDYLFNVVGETLHSMNDPIVVSKLISSIIHPTEQLGEVGIFVRSSFFMSIPLLPEETSHLSNCETYVKCPSYDEMFLNAAGREVVRHQRVVRAADTETVDKMISLLESIGVKLSADEKKQLQSRM